MSEYDRYSPFYKTQGMLRNFITYYESAVKAVESTDLPWNKVRESTADEWYQLSQVRKLFFSLCDRPLFLTDFVCDFVDEIREPQGRRGKDQEE
jgi:hypothetical protein